MLRAVQRPAGRQLDSQTDSTTPSCDLAHRPSGTSAVRGSPDRGPTLVRVPAHVRFFAPYTIVFGTSCNWFYVTTDAGRHWYLSTHLAQPVRFSAAFPGVGSTGIALLEVSTRSSGKTYNY